MAYYDLPKDERAHLSVHIHQLLLADFTQNNQGHILHYFNDSDTYIRKAAYLACGRIYQDAQPKIQLSIVHQLSQLIKHQAFYVRQTTVNAAGEIGKSSFETISWIMDLALFDVHHSVRNAVIGSVKKMSEKNPLPVLKWAHQYLHHPDKEIRREICHGIELRGRTHPEDILPLLQELEFDTTARVRNTLIHVLGQIAYKKGCLATVISHLQHWKNKALVDAAILEIIDIHQRYKNFAHLSQEEAIRFIQKNFPSTSY